jgi:hypothetical protein
MCSAFLVALSWVPQLSWRMQASFAINLPWSVRRLKNGPVAWIVTIFLSSNYVQWTSFDLLLINYPKLALKGLKMITRKPPALLPLPCLIFVSVFQNGGHVVVQLVDALRYKPEGRGFDYRCCLFYWRNPSGRTMALTISNRSENQEYLLGVKAVGA